MSFRQVKRRNETELSKHLWKLKDENKEYTVTWKIVAKAKPYTKFRSSKILSLYIKRRIRKRGRYLVM